MKRLLNRTPMITAQLNDWGNYLITYSLGAPIYLFWLLANGHFNWQGHYVFVWDGVSWYLTVSFLALALELIVRARCQQLVRQQRWRPHPARPRTHALQYLPGLLYVPFRGMAQDGLVFLTFLGVGIVALPVVLALQLGYLLILKFR